MQLKAGNMWSRGNVHTSYLVYACGLVLTRWIRETVQPNVQSRAEKSCSAAASGFVISASDYWTKCLKGACTAQAYSMLGCFVESDFEDFDVLQYEELTYRVVMCRGQETRSQRLRCRALQASRAPARQASQRQLRGVVHRYHALS